MSWKKILKGVKQVVTAPVTAITNPKDLAKINLGELIGGAATGIPGLGGTISSMQEGPATIGNIAPAVLLGAVNNENLDFLKPRGAMDPFGITGTNELQNQRLRKIGNIGAGAAGGFAKGGPFGAILGGALAGYGQSQKGAGNEPLGLKSVFSNALLGYGAGAGGKGLGGILSKVFGGGKDEPSGNAAAAPTWQDYYSKNSRPRTNLLELFPDVYQTHYNDTSEDEFIKKMLNKQKKERYFYA